MRTSSNKFTLVEVMIVVAIVGILSALAVPKFAQYHQDSQDRLKTTNITNVEAAKLQWKLDNPGADGSSLTIDDIKNYLHGIDSAEDLDVGECSISINAIGVDPSY